MANTITKENFIKYINKLKELRSIEDAINEVGKTLEFSINFGAYEQLIIDILTDAFDDDSSYGSWISYYLYDLNFGIDWHEGCITDKDGNDIPLRDAGELWDLLVSEMKEID